MLETILQDPNVVPTLLIGISIGLLLYLIADLIDFAIDRRRANNSNIDRIMADIRNTVNAEVKKGHHSHRVNGKFAKAKQ